VPSATNTRTKLLATLATLLLLAVVWSRTKAASSEELPPQHSRLQITTSGGSREFVIHVPAACDKSLPSPLVLMLHGFGGTALNAAKETGWSVKADEHAFIIAYPEATCRCHRSCGRHLLDQEPEIRKCPFPVLHHWPGGISQAPQFLVGKPSQKLNATDVIWEFFRSHPASRVSAVPAD
jgi:poly(3-hydroxybutyrate) depolymerase